MSRRAQLLCIWCGPALTVLFLVGAVILGKYIPPLIHPEDSAQEVANQLADNTDRIRIGAFLTIISMSLIVPFGIAIATQTRQSEGKFPVWTFLQLASSAIATLIVVVWSVVWVSATFRPDEYDPDTIRYVIDLSYLLFLFTWPPFSIWVVSIALSILMAPEGKAVYPRWVAYLNLWVGLLFVPAGLVVFFKSGAFSWAGLMALYVPVAIFFVWLIVMTVFTIKNINAGANDDAPVRRRPRVTGRAKPRAKAAA